MRTQTCLTLLLAVAAHGEPLRFNRDVRPILSENCFRCHGLDAKARKGELRLDVREGVDFKEVVSRITTHDADDKMPPPESHKTLTASQITTLQQWIAEGAVYERHWAFEPLAAGPGTCIDDFVEAKLRKHGLQLSPEAAPETLLRRVSFDLTGLPPTLEDLDDTYEHAVDRLLQSKHFGERMAVDWLDAARFADTNGYFGDKTRQMWLWRDWVIDAFNRNMPFDQFTIEQLAGDLLPLATTAQRIATGFNRNHMANNESGIIDEEYRTEYVIDRVDTTMTTWLGLTAACAQCHDHKYDPISQREFYQLFAFFNNVPETGLIKKDDPPPLIEVPSPEQQQQLQVLTTAASAAEKAFEPIKAALRMKIHAWEKEESNSLPMPPEEKLVLHESLDAQPRQGIKHEGTKLMFESGVRGQAVKFDATQHVEVALGDFDADKPWTVGVWLKPEKSLSCVLSKIEPEGDRRGLEIVWQKGRLQINLVHRWSVDAIEVVTMQPMSSAQWHHVVVSYDGSGKAAGLRVMLDGQVQAVEVMRDRLSGSIATAQPLCIGRRDSGLGFYGMLDELRILQRVMSEREVNDWFWGERIRGVIAREPAKRPSNEVDLLLDYYVEYHAESSVRMARQRMKQTAQEVQKLREAIPTTLVMQEMASPRTTAVLERGQYDKPSDKVTPGVPAAVAAWPAEAPRNRLGFARWLVSSENPLTARVAVNRLWQQCFGEGLVRSVNDFGSQGDAPTHPELLDWLALRFRESGWDVKGLLKLIVTSKAYRQRSQFHQDDPENRLLARGPSFRLSAEMIRDQALCVSGLLVPRIGGPSVKPYQPPGLWEAVSYNGEETYVPDSGEGLWRRSLYSFVKRQAPPPSLLTFDGPTREKCTVRRARTNTPLQALALLNDEMHVAAARALGEVIMGVAGSDEARLQQLWRRVLSREAAADEVAALRGLLQRQRGHFAADPAAATKLRCAPELAAWTVVAQTVLNLDETITRR